MAGPIDPLDAFARDRAGEAALGHLRKAAALTRVYARENGSDDRGLPALWWLVGDRWRAMTGAPRVTASVLEAAGLAKSYDAGVPGENPEHLTSFTPIGQYVRSPPLLRRTSTMGSWLLESLIRVHDTAPTWREVASDFEALFGSRNVTTVADLLSLVGPHDAHLSDGLNRVQLATLTESIPDDPEWFPQPMSTADERLLIRALIYETDKRLLDRARGSRALVDRIIEVAGLNPDDMLGVPRHEGDGVPLGNKFRLRRILDDIVPAGIEGLALDRAERWLIHTTDPLEVSEALSGQLKAMLADYSEAFDIPEDRGNLLDAVSPQATLPEGRDYPERRAL